MADNEEACFPRGRAPKAVTAATKKPVKQIPEGLFRESVVERDEKTKKVNHQKRKQTSDVDSWSESNKILDVDLPHKKHKIVEYLQFKTLEEGMLVLGCIKEINELDLVVSLPNSLKGFIKVTHISPMYTQALQNEIMLEKSEPAPTLQDLFEIGQLLVCSIQGLEPSTKRIQLSIEPRIVNSKLQLSKLKSGMKISGCIKSIEDHGYTVDVGKKVNAFMPITNSDPEVTLKLYQTVQCIIVNIKSDGKLLILSNDQRKINKSLAKSEHNVTLDTLYPGTLVKFTTTSVVEDGRLGTFLNFDASISLLNSYDANEDNIKEPKRKKKKHNYKEILESDDNDDTKQSSKHDVSIACVLYVSTNKQVALCTNSNVWKYKDRLSNLQKHEKSFSIGKICNVNVIRKVKGIGIICKVENDGPLGIIYLRNISDSHIEPNFSNFTDVKQLKARVVENVSLDGVLELNSKASVVNASYLRYEDLAIGQLVQAKILSVSPKGLQVVVGTGQGKEFIPSRKIRGFVSSIHMSDIILKHPEKKFNEGDVLNCRVLNYEPARRSLYLTHKRTFVVSKKPVISSYDQLKPGDIVHVFIVAIKESGCIVKLYNNVKGLVPKHELGSDFMESIEKEFFVGQVMRSRVVSCSPETQGLILSFNIKPRTSKDDQLLPPSDLTYNQVLNVEIIKKQEKGFDIVIVEESRSQKKWVKAFLPTYHLSDLKTVSEILYSSYKVGDRLQPCVLVSAKPLQVTMKASFVKFAQSRKDPHLMFNDLVDDMVLPGYVKGVMEYGVFVGVPGGMAGLCLKSTITDRFLPTTADYFYAGQSVVAMVTNVESDKKRFSLTLQPSSVINCDVGEEKISQYYKEREVLRRTFFKDINLKLGNLVNVSRLTTDSDRFSIEGFDETVVTGRIIDGDVKESGPAVVLYIDFAKRECVVTTLKSVIKFAESSVTRQVNSNTSLHCQVLFVNGDVTVAYICSGGENRGRLTCMSTAPFWNDSAEPPNRLFTPRQNIVAKVIKTTQDGVLLCRPEVERRTVKRVRQDSEASTSSVTSDYAQEFGDLEIGEEVEVTVRSIKPTCAIVHIPSHRTADGRPLTGRIHASEVVDCPEHNSKPLRRLKVGQALLCHVIGCRDVRTCKFLEITNRKAVKGIVELSLRRSFFDESNDGNMSRDRFDTGSQVVGFVKSYDKVHEQLTVEVLPGIRGVIEKLLISGNLGQKIKPSVHVGRAYHCTVLQDDGVHLKLASKGVHINGMTGNDVTCIEVGCITNGVVEKVLNDGLLIRTEFKGHGKAFTTDLFDEMFDSPLKEFTEGQIVRCRVLECENRCKMKLSLRKSLMYVGSEISNDDVMKSLKRKQVVKGYINGCTKEGVFITLSRHLHGRVTFEHATKYHCDVIQAQKVLYIGKLVTSYVLSVSPQGDRIELSLLPEHVGEKDLFDQVASSLSWKRSSNGDVDYVTAPKKRRVMLEKCSKFNVERSIHNASVKNEDVKTISTAIAEESAAEPGFVWDDNDDVKRSVDSSDEDSGIEDQKVDLKLTKREKAELAAREESELRRKEVELLDETKTPESAAEWERILAANPDNSMIWIRYIAFHLHATEIEKARAVAEKALKTINFREEKEKFNVWVSLLNLENLYGSDDTMEEVTRRALEQNDQLKVLNHLVSLYVQSGKNDKAEEVHQKLLKRYRGNKDVWLAYMKYLMEQDKHQEAQEIMKRSVKSLDRKHHLEIISKFAQMEFVFGDAERGRTMFENTISSYPKRTDVWSIYIDTLLKAKYVDQARDVFNRVTTLGISTKKMKSFFKRFVEFETKYGNDVSINEAKQKAIDYVEVELKRQLTDS